MRRALAPLLAATLVAAGCGTQDRRAIPAKELLTAVEQTRAAPSQRVRVEMTMSTLGVELHLTGTGVFDNRTREGRMTYDVSELADLAGASGAEADTAELVTIGRAAWVRSPVVADRLGTDREWIAFEPRLLGEQQGIDPGALSAAQGDLGPQLGRLRRATTGFEEVGDEAVRGVATTHYRSGRSEVWIGDDTGRVHRLRTQTQITLAGRVLEVDQAVELYDLGAPVGHVLPPPAADTAPLPGP